MTHLLIALVTLLLAPDAETLVVALRPKAEVKHTPVLLEDVADLVGPAAEVAQAKKLEICPAPATGKPRFVSHAGVRLAARLAGLDLPAASVVGAAQVEIVANWRELASDEIFAAAQTFVLGETEQLGDRVLLERNGRPDAVALLDGAGDATFLCAFVGTPSRVGGALLQVKVSVMQGSTLVGERVALFRARRFGKQLRLVTDVRRGESVGAAQVLMLDGEWTVQQGTPVVAAAEIAGMVAKSDLKAGQILVKESFEEPLLVDRGGSVRMVLKRGPLEIVALGVAQRAGRRGEVIPVMNPGTQKVLQAELIAKSDGGEVVARIQ